jgi:hypothetical protein
MMRLPRYGCIGGHMLVYDLAASQGSLVDLKRKIWHKLPEIDKSKPEPDWNKDVQLYKYDVIVGQAWQHGNLFDF